MRIHNCHVHVFTNQSVPNGFLPFGLVRLLRRPGLARVVRPVGRFLAKLNHALDSRTVDRYAALLNIGTLPSQRAVFEHLRGFYPADARFVVLPMDMAFMDAGKVNRPLEEQLDELARLKRELPDILFPFVAVDPRRPGFFDLVRRYVEDHGFHGIKLYPPLGYFPCDPRLNELYAYAEAHRLPIITHCSRGGVYSRKRITREMLRNPCTGEVLKKARKSRFTDHYADPRNYLPVLARFKRLKLCLAHFGGEDEWRDFLENSWDFNQEGATRKSWFSVVKDDLIRPHAHVYADISYTMYDPGFLPLLKVLLEDPAVRPRVLYGSDYYVVVQDLSERAFSVNVRAYLGEDLYQQIAEQNAEAFLFGKEEGAA